MSRMAPDELNRGRPSLSVVRGLTYIDSSQVFHRWLIPTYQKAFRWTGNRVDSENATTSVLLAVAGHVRYPELVRVVDDQMADAGLEAVARHWTLGYALAPVQRSEIYACEAAPTDRPSTLEALFAILSNEKRLVLV